MRRLASSTMNKNEPLVMTFGQFTKSFRSPKITELKTRMVAYASVANGYEVFLIFAINATPTLLPIQHH